MASPVASQSFHLMIYEQLRRNIILLTSYLLLLTSLASCGSSKFISKQADQIILSDSNLTSAHVGISIYDPSTNKYLYNHDGDKYFIPASNTKLLTCYAAMKHLGDSLVGLKVLEYNDKVVLQPTGDPTFLHPDFKVQPVYGYLKLVTKPMYVTPSLFIENALGYGWAWDDYNDDYMAERSFLPIYGNVIRFSGTKKSLNYYPRKIITEPLTVFTITTENNYVNKVIRQRESNVFTIYTDGKLNRIVQVPFKTSTKEAFSLLSDTLKVSIFPADQLPPETRTAAYTEHKIQSQPIDSLLKPMMHNSDNFFAEQALLMVSDQMLTVMKDEWVIDSLLRSDFKNLPQKPKWVDGCGLSRYNLFSPQDMITVLNKMKNDFSWNRITTILATGGEGTLTNYYINLKDRIFAKTGTLSNNVALSGFLLTKKNKTIIFSVLVNNHMGNTTQIRKAVERFLTSIAEKY